MIHSSAIVDPGAQLDEGVHVGPYSVIGADVEIGKGTRVDAHVVINGPTRIGSDNRIAQFNSIGDDPQDKKYAGERSRLEIGDRNVIREFCTLNRGTKGGGGITRVGNDNWIMAYVHVAHDCEIGSDVIMANGATLAGHVRVEDHVTFGAFTVVHQFCSLGAYSFSAMGTVVFKDVPPYLMIAGTPAQPHGLNVEGLKRRGFSATTVHSLKQAYRILYRQGLGLHQSLEAMQALQCPQVTQLMEFVAASKRGIVR